jgi:2-polyprenyl-3-methyl-5-hydroxy-6-metoxy-1,4-benzoquinol methylase
MTILEAINKYNKLGQNKTQLKYDMMREKIYTLASMATGFYRPKKVLDVGCAYGFMSYLLTLAKLKVTALDCEIMFNEKVFKDNKISFLKRNIETQDIPGKYDLILLMDVLEHLNYNPLPVLKKLCKAGKAIIITTPAREIDPVMPDKAKYKDFINWRMIPNHKTYQFSDSHHHTYTLWELKDLLTEAGFTIDKYELLPVEQTWFIRARRA